MNSEADRIKLAEAWRRVFCWDGYEVSSFGRVRGPRKVLMPEVMHTGYLRIQLYSHGIRRRSLVHRLVLEAFRGPCPDGYEAGHLNGIRADNRIENLEWLTPKENAAMRVAHGNQSRGVDSPTSKLTEDDVRQIRAKRDQYGTYITDLADEFGVSFSTINRIIRGELWTHVN